MDPFLNKMLTFASKLWAWWLDLWHIKWVSPSRIWDFFLSMELSIRNPFFKKVWILMFFIIIWSIWRERNYRIFENNSSSMIHIQDLILLRLGCWISGWNESLSYSPLDIQRNPKCLLWGNRSCLSFISNPVPKSMQASLWMPPELNYLKWNVDASFNLLSSRSATGGVSRNHHGKFVGIFSSPIPVIEINSAKVLAISRAMSISLSNPNTKLLL